MKNAKWLLLVSVTVVIVGGVAGVIVAKRQAAGSAAPHVDKSEATLTSPATHDVVPQEAPSPPEYPQPLKSIVANGQTNNTPQKAVARANQGGPPAKKPLKDPAAREALAWVGANAEAEAYWYSAINDPNLPPSERQDLIEDLNEDGLSDPKHPTSDDLPLIVSRLLLIEEVGPDSMDSVNADAFQEAYKDLVNLANLAMGGGKPVR